MSWNYHSLSQINLSTHHFISLECKELRALNQVGQNSRNISCHHYHHYYHHGEYISFNLVLTTGNSLENNVLRIPQEEMADHGLHFPFFSDCFELTFCRNQMSQSCSISKGSHVNYFYPNYIISECICKIYIIAMILGWN